MKEENIAIESRQNEVTSDSDEEEEEDGEEGTSEELAVGRKIYITDDNVAVKDIQQLCGIPVPAEDVTGESGCVEMIDEIDEIADKNIQELSKTPVTRRRSTRKSVVAERVDSIVSTGEKDVIGKSELAEMFDEIEDEIGDKNIQQLSNTPTTRRSTRKSVVAGRGDSIAESEINEIVDDQLLKTPANDVITTKSLSTETFVTTDDEIIENVQQLFKTPSTKVTTKLDVAENGDAAEYRGIDGSIKQIENITNVNTSGDDDMKEENIAIESRQNEVTSDSDEEEEEDGEEGTSEELAVGRQIYITDDNVAVKDIQQLCGIPVPAEDVTGESGCVEMIDEIDEIADKNIQELFKTPVTRRRSTRKSVVAERVDSIVSSGEKDVIGKSGLAEMFDEIEDEIGDKNMLQLSNTPTTRRRSTRKSVVAGRGDSIAESEIYEIVDDQLLKTPANDVITTKSLSTETFVTTDDEIIENVQQLFKTPSTKVTTKLDVAENGDAAEYLGIDGSIKQIENITNVNTSGDDDMKEENIAIESRQNEVTSDSDEEEEEDGEEGTSEELAVGRKIYITDDNVAVKDIQQLCGIPVPAEDVTGESGCVEMIDEIDEIADKNIQELFKTPVTRRRSTRKSVVAERVDSIVSTGEKDVIGKSGLAEMFDEIEDEIGDKNMLQLSNTPTTRRRSTRKSVVAGRGDSIAESEIYEIVDDQLLKTPANDVITTKSLSTDTFVETDDEIIENVQQLFKTPSTKVTTKLVVAENGDAAEYRGIDGSIKQIENITNVNTSGDDDMKEENIAIEGRQNEVTSDSNEEEEEDGEEGTNEELTIGRKIYITDDNVAVKDIQQLCGIPVPAEDVTGQSGCVEMIDEIDEIDEIADKNIQELSKTPVTRRRSTRKSVVAERVDSIVSTGEKDVIGKSGLAEMFDEIEDEIGDKNMLQLSNTPTTRRRSTRKSVVAGRGDSIAESEIYEIVDDQLLKTPANDVITTKSLSTDTFVETDDEIIENVQQLFKTPSTKVTTKLVVAENGDAAEYRGIDGSIKQIENITNVNTSGDDDMKEENIAIEGRQNEVTSDSNEEEEEDGEEGTNEELAIGRKIYITDDNVAVKDIQQLCGIPVPAEDVTGQSGCVEMIDEIDEIDEIADKNIQELSKTPVTRRRSTRKSVVAERVDSIVSTGEKDVIGKSGLAEMFDEIEDEIGDKNMLQLSNTPTTRRRSTRKSVVAGRGDSIAESEIYEIVDDQLLKTPANDVITTKSLSTDTFVETDDEIIENVQQLFKTPSTKVTTKLVVAENGDAAEYRGIDGSIKQIENITNVNTSGDDDMKEENIAIEGRQNEVTSDSNEEEEEDGEEGTNEELTIGRKIYITDDNVAVKDIQQLCGIPVPAEDVTGQSGCVEMIDEIDEIDEIADKNIQELSKTPVTRRRSTRKSVVAERVDSIVSTGEKDVIGKSGLAEMFDEIEDEIGDKNMLQLSNTPTTRRRSTRKSVVAGRGDSIAESEIYEIVDDQLLKTPANDVITTKSLSTDTFVETDDEIIENVQQLFKTPSTKVTTKLVVAENGDAAEYRGIDGSIKQIENITNVNTSGDDDMKEENIAIEGRQNEVTSDSNEEEEEDGEEGTNEELTIGRKIYITDDNVAVKDIQQLCGIPVPAEDVTGQSGCVEMIDEIDEIDEIADKNIQELSKTPVTRRRSTRKSVVAERVDSIVSTGEKDVIGKSGLAEMFDEIEDEIGDKNMLQLSNTPTIRRRSTRKSVVAGRGDSIAESEIYEIVDDQLLKTPANDVITTKSLSTETFAATDDEISENVQQLFKTPSTKVTTKLVIAENGDAAEYHGIDGSMKQIENITNVNTSGDDDMKEENIDIEGRQNEVTSDSYEEEEEDGEEGTSEELAVGRKIYITDDNVAVEDIQQLCGIPVPAEDVTGESGCVEMIDEIEEIGDKNIQELSKTPVTRRRSTRKSVVAERVDSIVSSGEKDVIGKSGLAEMFDEIEDEIGDKNMLQLSNTPTTRRRSTRKSVVAGRGDSIAESEIYEIVDDQLLKTPANDVITTKSLSTDTFVETDDEIIENVQQLFKTPSTKVTTKLVVAENGDAAEYRGIDGSIKQIENITNVNTSG